MESKEKFNHEQSLQLISEMISAAKNDVRADSFIFLLWGWLVLLASSGQLILAMLHSPLNWLPWMLMPLGGIITVVYSLRKRRTEKTRTAVTETLKHIWIAFSAALFIILFLNRMAFMQVMPCVMVLYGIGLYLSGAALRFRPLRVGGIFCWVCAVAGFLIQDNAAQLLILDASVLGGYLIPGYLLRNHNRK
jgi:hypothetical protein